MNAKRFALFTAFLLFFSANAFADKVQINDTELTLQSNTDQCLTDCEAWLEWDFTEAQTGFQVPAQASDSWKFEFIKRSIETPDLLEWGTETWKKKNVSVTDYCLEAQEYETDLNTGTCSDMGCVEKDAFTCTCTRDDLTECGSHFEKRWQKDADDFFGYHFEKGDVYRIRLWGKKQAKLGENDIDWIPTLAGIRIPQWYWWNGGWDSKFAINDLNIGSALEAGDESRYLALESASTLGMFVL